MKNAKDANQLKEDLYLLDLTKCKNLLNVQIAKLNSVCQSIKNNVLLVKIMYAKIANKNVQVVRKNYAKIAQSLAIFVTREYANYAKRFYAQNVIKFVVKNAVLLNAKYVIIINAQTFKFYAPRILT